MNKTYTNSFSLAKSDNNVNTNNVVNYPNPQPYKMTQIQAINNKPETVDPLVFSNSVTKNPENSQANKKTRIIGIQTLLKLLFLLIIIQDIPQVITLKHIL